MLVPCSFPALLSLSCLLRVEKSNDRDEEQDGANTSSREEVKVKVAAAVAGSDSNPDFSSIEDEKKADVDGEP